MKRYFVTGTGTNVGKTFVTCQLARAARASGLRVFAFKPVETGCSEVDGRLVGADQELLCEAAGGWQQLELRGLYQFAPPVAPWVAAEALGVEIDVDAILSTVARGAEGVDLVLIEGAGGWRVAITPACDMAELARRLGFPVVVVAQATLGTINHSLLTLETVERGGHEIAALVLSKHPGDDASKSADNARRIAAQWKGRIIIHSGDLRELAGLF